MTKEELISLARTSGNEHYYTVDYGMYDDDCDDSIDCCARSYLDGVRDTIEKLLETSNMSETITEYKKLLSEIEI